MKSVGRKPESPAGSCPIASMPRALDPEYTYRPSLGSGAGPQLRSSRLDPTQATPRWPNGKQLRVQRANMENDKGDRTLSERSERPGTHK